MEQLVGVMIFMKNPMFGTGKYVVMDSGFCVLKGRVGILACGLYGTTVIKKKNIDQSTARDMPLRNASKTRRLGVFMMFMVICMVTSKRYSILRRLTIS